ncbi:MAG: hypothetical protein OJF60_002772 [Burkholderiaceae bacterium]|nr:MAG: hypothetical protein OJF60_002772 [Burkholderiaceae bacterium]
MWVESDPPQSFSAQFDLSGNADAGRLALYNPLGGTIAVLVWAPGRAMLEQNGGARDFDSLDALVTHALGTAIPVTALFDWLRGTDTQAPGWTADLSQLASGRLSARRSMPLPTARLRVVLDR